MALIHLDGCDHSTTLFKYSSSSFCNNGSGGRYGIGNILRIDNGGAVLNHTIAPANTDDVITVGFAFRHSTQQSSGALILFMADVFATTHVGFYFSNLAAGSATIKAYRGTSAGTLLGTTAVFATVLNEWHYYEFKVKLHDTTGTVEIRSDGVVLLALTNQDTKNAGTETVVSGIGWRSSGANSTTALDDIYICNEAGSVNTTFLNEIVVETKYPNANGTYSGLVGSDANNTNNYLLVDEAGTDDADYVGGTVAGDKDTYNLGNLVRADGSILGIAVNQRLVRSDASAKSARRVLITKNGAAVPTIDNGADIALQSSFTWTSEIIEKDPVLVAAWTTTAINDLEVGIEVRTPA